MGFKIDIAGADSAEHVSNLDNQGFAMWDKRLSNRMGHVIGRNNFFGQHQVQWGHKAGVNTGNGIMEGSMSAELFLALAEPGNMFEGDPNWYTDDKKFYKFLREYPWHDARPNKTHSRGEKFSSGGGKS